MEYTLIQNQPYNVIKNTFSDFIELVVYHEDKHVCRGNSTLDFETGEILVKNADRTRKFTDNNGILTPTTNNLVKIENIQRTIKNSRKRALDNIFGYALCNNWDYFLTLTFDPTKIDRCNEDAVKYAWQLFRQQLQYIDRNVKLLCIPERHPTSNKLHFHVLVGAINLECYLKRAINPHTNKPIFSNGRAVYNLDLYTLGFSTLVKIDGDYLKIANYLTKYVIKDFGNIGYNKKTFYHTRNLNYKNKELLYLSSEKEKVEFLHNMSLSDSIVYKDNSDFTIYRIKLPFSAD